MTRLLPAVIARRVASALLAILALAAVTTRAHGQDLPAQKTTVYGGGGGTSFSRNCATGYVATGLRGRADMWVDAVGLLCAPLLADGSLGPSSAYQTLAGGAGGNPYSSECPAGNVMVAARIYTYKPVFASTVWLYSLQVGCRPWDKATRTSGGSLTYLAQVTRNSGDLSTASCTSNRQPVVAIRGRTATYVDALGLICDEP